jgi:hypothetical protein
MVGLLQDLLALIVIRSNTSHAEKIYSKQFIAGRLI